MADNDDIPDLTGQRVRYICKSGQCPKGVERTAILQQSDQPMVKPIPGGSNQKYAGHIAICESCGGTWLYYHNFQPQD